MLTKRLRYSPQLLVALVAVVGWLVLVWGANVSLGAGQTGSADSLRVSPVPRQPASTQYELPAPTPERGLWFSPVVMQRPAYYATIPRGGYLLSTREEWANFWDQTHDQGSNEPLPEVDFGRIAVVAVYAGPQPHGQVRIRIRRIIDTPSLVHVDVEEQLPGDGCVTTLDTPNPGSIVLTEKPDRAIQFHVDRTRTDCYGASSY
jgi:hypothetical protein